jgi:hypothetical protein
VNRRMWILGGVLFSATLGAWGMTIQSRRVFMKDFDAGVRFYLANDPVAARPHLEAAHAARPRNPEAKDLLVKVLIEEGIQSNRAGDAVGARVAFERASALLPVNDPAQASIQRWMRAPEPSIPSVGSGLQPPGLPAEARSPVERWEGMRAEVLWSVAQSQSVWMERLHRERQHFVAFAVGGLVVFLAMAAVVFAIFARLLNVYFGRRGVLSQLLEMHYQALSAALPSAPHPLIAWNPTNGNDVRKIEAIEAELIGEKDPNVAQRLLRGYLETKDPWVRARAAQVIHKLDADGAWQVVKALLSSNTLADRLSAVWALEEMATLPALEALTPLLWSRDAELQKSAIRCLIRWNSKKELPPEMLNKVESLLVQVRTQTDWIV